MRIRATAAAVTGALALSALIAPSVAQADDAHRSTLGDIVRAARSASPSVSGAKSGARSAAAAPTVTGPLDLTFSKVTVNGGKPVVLGTSAAKNVPTTFTVTHAAAVDIFASDFQVFVALYRGSFDDPGNELFPAADPTCKATSSTVATCKGTVYVSPVTGLMGNADATTWKAEGIAVDYNGQDPENADPSKIGFALQENLASAKVQRASTLTVNAAPEPVKKGKTLTITGKLSRANWDDLAYHGYASQSVKLQFRKKTSSTYTTVKTIKASSTGTLKTTAKASVDGYWRYSFTGTSTTPAVSAAGDFVDVK